MQELWKEDGMDSDRQESIAASELESPQFPPLRNIVFGMCGELEYLL